MKQGLLLRVGVKVGLCEHLFSECLLITSADQPLRELRCAAFKKLMS